MTSTIANSARRCLIRLGKVLPFVFCFVVLIAYVESLFSLATSDYLTYNGTITLNTPLSFNIAKIFIYDWFSIIALIVISYAIETCVWNRIAILYLAFQLAEKTYLSNVELYEEYIYVVAIANIIASGLLTIKGIRILIK